MALCVLAVTVLCGCSGPATGLTSIDGYLRRPNAVPKVRPDGLLTNDPPRITQAAVDRQPPDSPQRLIERLWMFGQAGQPGIAGFYEPDVQRAIGTSRIISAYAPAQGYMAATSPEIVRTLTSGAITTVNILVFSKGGPPVPETYDLSRRTGRLLIAYDTFLAANLDNYIQNLRRAGGATPAAAAAAGAAAATAFQANFIRSVSPAPAALRRAIDRGTWSSTSALSSDKTKHYHLGDVVTYTDPACSTSCPSQTFTAAVDRPLAAPSFGPNHLGLNSADWRLTPHALARPGASHR
ncbi:MAG TPA: hypothetical protein VFN75_03580 [Pseudonocardiaceae bacterium]|nr:hypothetical protein [Pseudonocardiaceae bacterium]